jgi:hypothetical protein
MAPSHVLPSFGCRRKRGNRPAHQTRKLRRFAWPLTQRSRSPLKAQLPFDRGLIHLRPIGIYRAQIVHRVMAGFNERAIGHDCVMAIRQHDAIMEPALAIRAHLVKVERGCDFGQSDTLRGMAAALAADIQHVAADFGLGLDLLDSLSLMGGVAFVPAMGSPPQSTSLRSRWTLSCDAVLGALGGKGTSSGLYMRLR